MKHLSKESASWHDIGAEEAGQRIDNCLIRWLKGVPKSHVYRVLRSGEVRVNSRRIGPEYRLRDGDRVRLPPVRIAAKTSAPAPRAVDVEVLYEDAALLVINKPAGLAVHGGSGVSHGAIEQLRAARPQAKFLELAHRLDRDTSGVLMLAKKRSALTALHEQLREGRAQKRYLALVRGAWRGAKRAVKAPLQKYVLASGERRVAVNAEGQAAHTVFHLRQCWSAHEPPLSLLECELRTGRTHQIRVHLAHIGFPIVGDAKYGDDELNKTLQKQLLNRMFLHASRLVVTHPESGEPLQLQAPLPQALSAALSKLDQSHATAI
jgi:23S rRNA pseudouridine955/2504/2580 synthase